MIHCPTCGVVPVQARGPAGDASRTTSTSTGPATRSTAIRPGATSPARNAADRRSARPTRWTPSSTRPGISPASPRRTRRRRPTARPPIAGCRSTSISAASSTRSCTSSIRASSRARMKKTGHVGLDEPFAGLFTQGMVVHETYRSAEGRMAGARRGAHRGRRRRAAAPSPIATGDADRDRPDREDVEVEAEHRRPVRHHRDLRRRHGALVHALRFAAGARRDLDGGRRRGRAPLRAARLAAVTRLAGRAAAAGPAAPGDLSASARSSFAATSTAPSTRSRTTSSGCASTAPWRSSTS